MLWLVWHMLRQVKELRCHFPSRLTDLPEEGF
jgi:hypothetical protein